MTQPRPFQSVLIGGADGSLGLEATGFFARQGLRVMAVARTDQTVARIENYIRDEGLTTVTPVVCDLAAEKAVSGLIGQLEGSHGPIDLLLNAAGGFRYVSTEGSSADDFDFLMSANFKSSWLLAKALAPRMRERNRGRMIFVSARATLAPAEANMGLYTASKAALNALVTSLANELKSTDVRVNAVLPTVIDTPANRQAMPKANPDTWVSPKALLEVVQFLMSPAAQAINGALLPVAGQL